MSDREAKKHLRAALRADPEAFDRLVREYLEDGAEVLAASRPGENAGRKKEIEPINYALLLADVRNRAERLSSENEALKEIANAATGWGKHNAWRKKIMNKNTAGTHLKKAKELEQGDPEFAEDVSFWRWALSSLDMSKPKK